MTTNSPTAARLDPTRSVPDRRLVCRVARLEYDFPTHAGRIYFPPGNCCDMAGCIDLFRGIDPEVRLIDAFAGEKPDIRYERLVEGGWLAQCRRREARP